jgi:hypothetical protein
MSPFVLETWKKQWTACWSAPLIMLPLSVGVVVGLLLAATPANAMTGLEFLKVCDDGGFSDEADVMKPLVRQFVMEGYHSVPNWPELGSMAQKLIREKGYRDKDIAEIAREAAIANGMSK